MTPAEKKRHCSLLKVLLMLCDTEMILARALMCHEMVMGTAISQEFEGSEDLPHRHLTQPDYVLWSSFLRVVLLSQQRILELNSTLLLYHSIICCR